MDFEWKRHWEAFRAVSYDHPATARKGFMLGMATRMRARLYQMDRDRKSAQAAPAASRALVVVDVVDQAYEKLGLRLQTWEDWGASGRMIPAGPSTAR